MIDTIDSPYVHAGTDDNFARLVLENSRQGPVLVNFWSRKAGPCLRQYPILDKLVHDYAGRLLLVNVDTDNEVASCREYGIASVPTLKLFRNGEVVETWHGFQNEEDLRKVLDVHVARDSDAVLVRAVETFAAGETREAYEMIAEAIVEDPVNPRLPLTMCKLLRHENRIDEALKLLDSLPPDVHGHREIEKFHSQLRFFPETDLSRDIDELREDVTAHPDDMEARRRLAARYVTMEDYGAALDELAHIIDTDASFDEEYGRTAMLRIFAILGIDHELVARHRAKLMRYTH